LNLLKSVVEALFAVDDGADLSGRKNEPMLGRGILYTSHFTELEERGGLFFAASRLASRSAWRDFSRARFFWMARLIRCS
jgi:hypothetical protein